MASNNTSDHENKQPVNFQSLHTLAGRVKDGTFGEIIDDWKWIFSYSIRYKGAILFYTILGIVSTSLGLISSIASKYLIDIITGYKTEQLGMMIAIMTGSRVCSKRSDSGLRLEETPREGLTANAVAVM